jgi:hypothetical protein
LPSEKIPKDLKQTHLMNLIFDLYFNTLVNSSDIKNLFTDTLFRSGIDHPDDEEKFKNHFFMFLQTYDRTHTNHEDYQELMNINNP